MTIQYSIKEKHKILRRFRGTIINHVWLPCALVTILTICSSVWEQFVNGVDHTHYIPWMPSWFIFVIASTISFLGVYMTGIVYTRFWGMRYQIGYVMGRANDVAVMMRAYLWCKDPAKLSRMNELRKRFMRFINLGHALCYWQAQHKPDKGLVYYHSLGLLSMDEAQIVRDFPSSAYLLAFGWANDTLRIIYDEGFICDDHILEMFVGNVTVCRQGAYDVFMFLNTPLPLPYFHMYVVMLYTYFTILVIFLPTTLNHYQVSPFWAVPLINMQCFFYFGMGGLTAELENPFEFDANDFDTSKFVTGTATSSLGCATQYQETSLELFKQESDHATSQAKGILPCLKMYDFCVSNGYTNDIDFYEGGLSEKMAAQAAAAAGSVAGEVSDAHRRQSNNWDMLF